jgi:CHAT domain-containing protein
MVAFVWTAGAPEPRLVRLADPDSIAALVEAWDGLLRAPERGHAPRASDERAARAAGARVRARVWDPLARELAGAREVFVVPAGPLLDLRWAALPWDGKRYWVEAGPVMRVLNAERELLAPPLEPAPGGLLAFGGMEYGQDAQPTMMLAARFRAARTDCRDARPPRFEPLPATVLEVQAIAASWPGDQGTPRVLQGRDATEQACFELAGGYRVLHLATHGYVPRDTCAAMADGMRGVGGVSAITASAPGRRAKTKAPAPAVALRPASSDTAAIVWLAFTGADHAVAHEDPAGDGLLTPEEAMTLDLTGTEWVVLSACYSTRGRDEWAREGLSGMRRAFHMAGARTVIGSSWAVGDEAGAEWMRALYAARARGAGTAGVALHRASASVLAARRASGRSTHPFHWASFSATGE